MGSLADRIGPWIPLAIESGNRHGVSASLILAIIDRESNGGEALHPPGPGGTGDEGNGLGLCQIDKRFHQAFFAETLKDGTPAWKDPARNIDMAASILADELARFSGDEDCAAASYNAGPHRVRVALSHLTIPRSVQSVRDALDAITTGGDYVTDTMRRRALIRRLPHPPKESP